MTTTAIATTHSSGYCQGIVACGQRGQTIVRADGGLQWACSGHAHLVPARYSAVIATWVAR